MAGGPVGLSKLLLELTMTQYWEITYTRGIETLTVWDMDPAFTLKGCTMAQHQTRIASLQTLAAARTAAEHAHATARAERGDFFAKLHDLNVRLTQTVDGDIADDSDLHA